MNDQLLSHPQIITEKITISSKPIMREKIKKAVNLENSKVERMSESSPDDQTPSVSIRDSQERRLNRKKSYSSTEFAE